MTRKLGLRGQALLDGQKTFFTGKECSRGHLAPRYTSSGQCVECVHPGAKKRERRMAGWHGLKMLPLLAVHPDDYDHVIDYLRILNAQRGLKAPDAFVSPVRQNSKPSKAAAAAAKLSTTRQFDPAAHTTALRDRIAAKAASGTLTYPDQDDE